MDNTLALNSIPIRLTSPPITRWQHLLDVECDDALHSCHTFKLSFCNNL